MYYRRKIELALLQQFGGVVAKIDFQKLLFLFSQKQSEPTYHFVPYKFGGFSWQANQDMSTLTKYGKVKQNTINWEIIDNDNYSKQLTSADAIVLMQIYNQFKHLRGNELIRYVYEQYPYYAINSEIAGRILDSKQFSKVQQNKPVNNDCTLFTIGYEGKSVEQYVNLLIQQDVKLLCDVRKNPISMKYGFSKSQLKMIVEGVGIRYEHFPELGIESQKRQELNSMNDYEVLFEDYRQNTLPFKKKEVNAVYEEFRSAKRIALTCFEKEAECCHRNSLANTIKDTFKDANIFINHL
ncbi:MAG: DUF488 domain-containing protein [Bacteroidetes bacterium]|nr:DUF488 domain-containing protein [Bacteroidota bacterium]